MLDSTIYRQADGETREDFRARIQSISGLKTMDGETFRRAFEEIMTTLGPVLARLYGPGGKS